jgi:multidrug efflux system membrane fusion protein
MRNTLLAMMAALLVAACSDTKPVEEPVRPVLAMQVQPAASGSLDVYSGEVRARYESDLGFRVGGKLVARLADAGATVRRGQALARLDPEDARLAAAAAAAQLAAAESEYALAKAELARHQDLLARKFISASAFDAKQNAFNAAQGRLEQARSQAAISSNQANYTTLVADADGIIVSVSAEPGQVVSAGQAVMKLARAGEREVVINAPENQLARFEPGASVAVSLWADPSRLFTGRIREVAGGADPMTRTYAVRVAMNEAPADVRLGMSANVHLKSAADAAVLVPLTAIARSREAPAVWVVDPATKRVKLRPVAVGQFREDGATVTSGLAPGEWIVTAGVHKLRADQVVRLAASAPRMEAATQ